MSLFADGVTELRRFADYRGRSTRTDLGAFWLVTFAAGILLLVSAAILEFAVPLASSPMTIVTLTFQWLLLVPMAALLARRLHDRGLSAWWLALALPALVLNAFKDYYRLTGDYEAMLAQTRSMPYFIGALLGLALVIFLLLPGEEGANRYGPNPRYDPPGEAARKIAGLPPTGGDA